MQINLDSMTQRRICGIYQNSNGKSWALNISKKYTNILQCAHVNLNVGSDNQSQNLVVNSPFDYR